MGLRRRLAAVQAASWEMGLALARAVFDQLTDDDLFHLFRPVWEGREGARRPAERAAWEKALALGFEAAVQLAVQPTNDRAETERRAEAFAAAYEPYIEHRLRRAVAAAEARGEVVAWKEDAA